MGTRMVIAATLAWVAQGCAAAAPSSTTGSLPEVLGCYEVQVLEPLANGQIQPPTAFRLDQWIESRTGAEKLVLMNSGEPEAFRAMDSHWRKIDPDGVVVWWSNYLWGVQIRLRVEEDRATGMAEPFSDAGTPDPYPVQALRVPCGEDIWWPEQGQSVGW